MRLFQKSSLKALRTLALTSSVLALSGCSVFESYSEIKTLNNTAAVGSPFTQALADEYRRFANEEYSRMFDYPDALHFARKGLAAAAGKTVMPEPVTDWNLTAENAKELGAARGRLIVMLDQGARETAPALAARAQASFDCWIEQQEENWQNGDVAACKSAFAKAVQELEASVKVPPPPVETVVQPLSPFNVDATRPMAPENAMYLVFFNWNA
ncbi:MAG: OmpA family protein, partial [Alphaproteobacteria bacterium]|nr:OmpA family protein [Alphaproteobacteria bacterium]